MNPRLIKLFKDMSELTAPECASSCRVPHSCCSPEYCDLAEQFIIENKLFHPGYTLDPKLKFMNINGCILEPHKRPLCTLHVCSINSHGFKPNDLEFTKKYFDIRNEIDDTMFREYESKEK